MIVDRILMSSVDSGDVGYDVCDFCWNLMNLKMKLVISVDSVDR